MREIQGQKNCEAIRKSIYDSNSQLYKCHGYHTIWDKNGKTEKWNWWQDLVMKTKKGKTYFGEKRSEIVVRNVETKKILSTC